LLGDPRIYFFSAWHRDFGSIIEKISYLRYLLRRSTHGANVADELLASSCGNLYTRVLKPFLTGVFLADPSQVDATTGRNIIKSFIKGKPALPATGAGRLTQESAQRFGSIETNVQVNALNGLKLSTSVGEIDARAIILATNLTTAAQLLDIHDVGKTVGCKTWYQTNTDPMTL